MPHFLVVDDDKVNRIVVERLLQHLGCTVETVSSGYDALEAVRRKRYDVVLMDFHMPLMDGLETTRAIRSLGGEAASTLIIALTANASKEAREQCVEAGMDGYVTKPLQFADLKKILFLIS